MSSSPPGPPFCWVWKWSWLVLQQRRTQASQVSGCHLWKWTLLFFKSVNSRLVRENDGRIKTKDNPNKFNFTVKYTDRRDYKSWLHLAGFISTWISENPVNKHFVISLNFLCLGLFILCCLFMLHFFLIMSWLGICVEVAVDRKSSTRYSPGFGIRDLTKIQWGIRETLTGFDCNWKRDSPMPRDQDPASRPLVYCMMTGSSCSDVLVLFLLLMPADLQENMLISVRCQTRLHIIGATVVAEETGGVAPRTGKMVQTYGIWF